MKRWQRMSSPFASLTCSFVFIRPHFHALQDLSELRSAARALLNPKAALGLPPERRTQLQAAVVAHLVAEGRVQEGMELTPELLAEAAAADPRRPETEW